MTQIPSGWYTDPTPAQPDVGPSLRWWDGSQWTEHVAVPPPMAQPSYPSYPTQPSYPAQPSYPTQPYSAQGHPGTKPPATTPDGQPLAGWWQRVGAVIIDGLITVPTAALVGLPFLIPLTREFADEWDQAMDDLDSGGDSQVFGADFQADVFWYIFAFGLIALLVGAIYEILFLRWKQATLGKMVVGVQVRLREQPGRLTWGCVLLRCLVKRTGSILGQIPFIGGFLNLAWTVNYLWPLWDDKKQALHDKAARTNVVRVR